MATDHGTAKIRRGEVLRLLDEHRTELQQLGVASLRLFGSVARDEASSSSDVDLLVRFETSPTFSQFMRVRIFIEDLLGAKVDLVTEKGLKDRARPYVERDAIRVA